MHHLTSFIDIQYRRVQHTMYGFDTNPDLLVDRKFNFINPKFGLSTKIKNTTYYSSPKQIGALTTWTSIGGNGHGMAGISIGQLYYWGGWFQLVNGGYSYKSSPTQIGSDTNWLKISAGNPITLLKTNGTLWSAGYNGDGVAGLNNTTAYTSPKQIGSKTSWVGISSNLIGSVQSALSSE